MITDLIQSSQSRLDGYRTTCDLTVKRAGMSRQSQAASLLAGSDNQSSLFGGLLDDTTNKATRQYSHFRDVPYAAIRPIACKIADLALHVGMVPRKRRQAGKSQGLGFLTKQFAPDFVKAMSEDIDPVENHEFIEDIMDPCPHPHMTYWATMFCTVVSIYLTGRAYWWMVDDPDGGTQYWYLPATWVKPVADSQNAFAGFSVNPPWNTGEGTRVPMSDMAFFGIPDPANPLSTYAPLQSQARAVDTDDMVQDAQYATMKDGVNPKTIITVGKTPTVAGIPGSGERIELTPDQRKQLVSEIMTWYSGAMKRGLPFVVDRKIEGIEPFGRSAAELDFVNGAKLTSDRVHHGLGVNRIVTGATEGANRASAVVADTYFYALVVNPLGTHMSQTMTKQIGPRYSTDTKRAVIWIEQAEATDPALVQGRMKLAVDSKVVTKGEIRQFVSTGLVSLPKRDDDDDLLSQGGGKGPAAGGQDDSGGVGGDVVSRQQANAPGDKTGASDGDVRDDLTGDKKTAGDELDWILKGVEIGKRQAESELTAKAGDPKQKREAGKFRNESDKETTERHVGNAVETANPDVFGTQSERLQKSANVDWENYP